MQLAPSAFLASAAATSDLVHLIVPPYLQSLSIPNVDEAKDLWSLGHGQSTPEVTSQHQQRAWGIPKMSALAESLLENAPDPRARARLLASATKESGVWLNVLPISSRGLCMDNDTIRVAAGLRLGAPLCMPHSCYHCGEEVDCLAMHGLSCRWSEGRHHRHAAMNGIIHRTLAATKVPSRLEPSGLYRTDGKRPDDITVVPWKSGKLLVWDFFPLLLFNCHQGSSSSSSHGRSEKGSQVCQPQQHLLSSTYAFTPVAIETLGVFGPQTATFLKDLGHRLAQVTGDKKSTTYLLQRLSVAVQRGNVASVLGTIGHPT